MESIAWLIICVVLLAVEALTLNLTTIWFAIGAVVAFFVSLAGAGIPVQCIVFCIVSLILLILTKPIAVKYMTRQKAEATNVDSFVGEQAKTLTVIDSLEGGTALCRGKEWLAYGEDGKEISAGEVLFVKEVQGVRLILSHEDPRVQKEDTEGKTKRK